MSKSGIILVSWYVAAACSGCTSIQLRKHTNQQLRTTSEIIQQQVMDNVAKISANEYAWPEFSNFSTGTTQVTDSGEASVNLAWNARTITQEIFGLRGNRTLVEKWDTKATTDPARLRAMWAVYHYTIYGTVPDRDGYSASRQLEQVFHTKDWQKLIPPPGWINSYCEHEYCEKVRCGCVVGHACDCHACVIQGHEQDLQQLTYLIMLISGSTYYNDEGKEAPFPDGAPPKPKEYRGSEGEQLPQPGPAKDFNTFSTGPALTPR